MKASDIIQVIESLAPLEAAASWDASGVQVAALRSEVNAVAVMLDPTLESLERAAALGADFVVAHHPLSMTPRFPNRADGYLAVLSLLLTRGMWLYSAHTSLDANPAGPVRWLSDAFGLEGVEVLEPAKVSVAGAPTYGFGFVGTLPDPLDYFDFCRKLGVILHREQWQACGPSPERVRRVACCPGSGGSMLERAVAAGADVFLTGDIRYHAALEAGPLGLRVLDVGHFLLEEEMMRLFADQLGKALPAPVTFVPARDPLLPERA